MAPVALLTAPVGRKVSDGLSLAVTVPQSTTLEQGSLALLDGFFGMVVQRAETGAGETARVTLLIEQCEYETRQITAADPFTKGQEVYFDAATRLLTTTAGTNRLVGRVTNPKDANGVVWFLLGPQAQRIGA